MLIISWNVRPSLSFVRIKYWPRAEEEITLEEIPYLKCSIFGLNMLVYILNTVSLYFIIRVAFLVIVRLKIDFKIHVIIMMDCGSIRQSFQIIIAITILWRVKTYDDNISDSCWFNFATIIMENLTMIYIFTIMLLKPQCTLFGVMRSYIVEYLASY